MDINLRDNRSIAYLMYLDIITRKIFIEEALLNKHFLHLNSKDKAFIRNLISTAFRNYYKINFVLDKFIKPNTMPEAKAILNLALTEIMVLNTPDYAAVNSYVNLTKSLNLPELKGFINAVLKNVCKKYNNILENYDYSNNWLFKLWRKDYGEESALKICRSLEQRNSLDLVFKNQEFIKNNHLEGINLFPGLLRVNNSLNLKDLPGYNEGEFWVQGASSFIAVSALKNLVKEKIVADLCSAPGGKAFLLNNLGAKKVISFDISKNRLSVMEDNLKRLKLQDKIILKHLDILTLSKEDLQECNIILLDVPCLATGTIKKHPEIMYLKSKEQLGAITKIQNAMLNNITHNMPVNSVLLYSNCSLQKEEGEFLIKKFLANNKNFAVIPLKAEEIFNYPELITPEKFLRILPYHLANHGGMEGFFAAKITKVA